MLYQTTQSLVSAFLSSIPCILRRSAGTLLHGQFAEDRVQRSRADAGGRHSGLRAARTPRPGPAATNKNLEAALSQGSFREDLYYRLNVFTICVPPLRERKADVLLLADHFVEKYARLHGRSIKRISTPAIDMLVSYHWPGNVRELENTLERAVLVADSDVIHGHHLSPILQTAEASGTVISASLAEAVGAFESNLIQDALKTTRGNRARAARLLGSTERIINYKIRRYGIDPRRFRD